MGKSNRIRNDRANDVLFGGPAPKKKNGMPSWALNAIAIAGAVLLLVGVALLALTSNGVFGRMQTVMKTDNFRVTENMMNYYAKSQYSSFVEENGSYLSAYGLDTSKPLEDQAYETDANGNVTKTWRDIMMDSTVEQVKEILVYCEAARAAGFDLDDEAKQSIEDQLSMYEIYANYYSMSVDNYVAANYGKGMKLKDIRAAVELATLATEYSEKVGTDIEAAISKDDIKAEYDANKLDYDLVDYYKYTFSVTLEDAKEAVEETLEDGVEATDAQIIAKYKEMIAEERAKAEALSKITDKDALRAEIIKIIAEDTFDDSYESAMKNIKDDDKKDHDVRQTVIDKVIEAVKDDSEFVVKSTEATETEAAKEGLTSTTKDGDTTVYTVLGKTATEEYYNAFVKFADSFYTSVKKAATNSVYDGAKYDETDEAIKWMFGDGEDAVAGAFKTIEAGDTKEDLGTESAKLKSFSATVYYIVNDVYQDTDVSKNLGIIIFSDKTKAESAAAKLGEIGEITAEKLEALAVEFGGSYTDYKDCAEGAVGVDAFDAWVFADGRTKGSYTTAEEIITLSSASDTTSGTTTTSNSYAVVWYYGDGLMDWEISAKGTVYSDRFTAQDKEFKDTYAVSEPKEKLLDKIAL